MTRLPTPPKESLDANGQAVWDRIAAVRSPEMRGPFGVLMHIPELADRVAHLEDYFRFDAELPADERELVVLATTREARARYAWARHVVRGQEVGTRPEAIEALRIDASIDALTPREQLLISIVRELLRHRTLSQDLFKQASEELGTRQLIEIVTLTGHYHTVSLVLGAFDVPPPEGGSEF